MIHTHCSKHGPSPGDSCFKCDNERHFAKVDRDKTAQRKRDRFELAKAAMQGLCAAYDITQLSDDGGDARISAAHAIEHADALLVELDKEAS